jgi:REP element-mobilizing transposase RayT
MLHNRHSIRLPGYDYSQEGCYYVTIVTQDREPIFGQIVDDDMELSDYGCIVELTWRDLEVHNPDIGLGEFVVMPNHIHGIIQIFEPTADLLVGAGSKPAQGSSIGAGRGPAPTGGIPKRTPLSEIVRQFKTFSAKRINELRGTPGITVWQRNYFEHIIRNEKDYENTAIYIAGNPMNWLLDEERNL